MILIADSGSTKTEWAFINGQQVVKRIKTIGFNPYYYKAEEFFHVIKNELSGNIPDEPVEIIYYYGAGCSTIENCFIVSRALEKLFPGSKAKINHDLYGTALALLNNEKGIACILGTGSNACLWDGQKVEKGSPSLGYLLGDEGSGTYLGKLLLRGILTGEADYEITSLFYQENKLNFSGTLDILYKLPNPNKFMSEMAMFIKLYIGHPYCQKLVMQSFQDFVSRHILKFPEAHFVPVSFSGSIAFHFQKFLKIVLAENSIILGKILQEPMEGLIEYHVKHPAYQNA
jgi:N-acetylglucosamine kinase-like BadF-type ATPase